MKLMFVLWICLSFRAAEKAKPKELDSQVPHKESPKEDKQQ